MFSLSTQSRHLYSLNLPSDPFLLEALPIIAETQKSRYTASTKYLDRLTKFPLPLIAPIVYQDSLNLQSSLTLHSFAFTIPTLNYLQQAIVTKSQQPTNKHGRHLKAPRNHCRYRLARTNNPDGLLQAFSQRKESDEHRRCGTVAWDTP